MAHLSDIDSDMTNPLAPVPDPLPLDEAVQRCSAFWGHDRWNEYRAKQDRRHRISKRRRKIKKKELGPIIKTGGLLRENGRIRKSLRIEDK